MRDYATVKQKEFTLSGSYNDFIDVINFGFEMQKTNQLSFGAWINPDFSPQKNNVVVIGKPNSFRLRLNHDGSGHCGIATLQNAWNSDGTTASWNAGKVSGGKWHHVMCVYDGNNLHAYIDGIRIGSSANLSGNVANKPDQLRLGHPSAKADNAYKGAIRNFLIENQAYTATRVREMYQSTKPSAFSADLTDVNDKPGDQVNIFDYNILVSNFGKNGAAGWIKADIDKNGKVNIFDYNILVGAFGK